MFPTQKPALSLRTLLVPALLFAAGCANPGTPRPPSLHLPALAENLHATRLGNQVLLAWTTPSASTDGGPIHFPITAVLCRDTLQNPKTPACTTFQRLPTAPGPAHATDTLPPALLTAPPTLLLYRVQLFNREGRTAGPSEPVFAASGPAPAPLTGFAISPVRAGALLTWHPAATPGTIEITRTTPGTKPIQLQPTLRPQGAPNGTIDPTPRDPKLDATPFTYTAQRVLTLTLAGHPLTLRGLPSPTLPFLFHDTFPPDAPTGLVTIPSLAPLAIDLSWEPSADPDLLGYNLYRHSPGQPFTRLNPQPLPSPAFRDLALQPRTPYTYRVTALDRHHNESAPSLAATETVQP